MEREISQELVEADKGIWKDLQDSVKESCPADFLYGRNVIGDGWELSFARVPFYIVSCGF